MTPKELKELHKIAKEISAANMRHEKAMKEACELMASADLTPEQEMWASELEECLYHAKANHSRLNRIGKGVLDWAMPAPLSR